MTSRDMGGMMGSFRLKCEQHGLKMTPQRFAIYEELLRSRDHPSADAVYRKVRRKFPNISFDTVNRSLLTFSKIGLLHVVEGYGEAKRYDPDLEPHHHLRCVNCGDIIDFQDRTLDAIEVPASIRKKYRVIGKKVMLEVICDKCQRKG